MHFALIIKDFNYDCVPLGWSNRKGKADSKEKECKREGKENKGEKTRKLKKEVWNVRGRQKVA